MKSMKSCGVTYNIRPAGWGSYPEKVRIDFIAGDVGTAKEIEVGDINGMSKFVMDCVFHNFR